MKNNKPNKVTAMQKQKIFLKEEVSPENAFTKMTVIATRAASKYQLNTFKLETK